jgi:hypothetical protein
MSQEDPILLDPSGAAQKKTADSLLQTTAGKVVITISLVLFCILLIWAMATGNFFKVINALSK